MDGDRVGLGDAGEEAGDEQHEGVDGGAGQEHEETEGEAGDADDRASTDPVGEPPHGAGAEHEERHRCGRDEGDRAVGDAEGLGDVGAEDVDRGLLEFVEGVEQQQHDEGEEAAFAEPFLERHLVAADTGQEIVGEDDVGRPLGLTRLAGGLFIEHCGGARRRACRVLDVAHASPNGVCGGLAPQDPRRPLEAGPDKPDDPSGHRP